MAIKLETLRVFRAVTEAGTLAQAADALGRTPSALSMTLSQLEAEIGAPLFETDRKNRLTPLGLMVLEEAERATKTFEDSLAAIRRHALSTAGTVRIAAVPTATVTILPAAIASYRRTRPDVRLEISDVDSATVQSRLQRDEADIGILSASIDGNSAGTEVLRDPLGIVCRSDGPLAQAARESPGDPGWDLLALEPFVVNPLARLVGHPAVARSCDGAALTARNTTTLLSFVRAGLGTTILPSSVMQTEAAGLDFIAPQSPEAWRRLMLLENPARQLSPAARAFCDILGSQE